MLDRNGGGAPAGGEVVIRIGWVLLTAAVLALGVASPRATAGEVSVAVAANFTEPAKEIAAGFERATGHKATLSFGSSGKFYAQIANGAPFHVLLSADAERPAQAEAAGLAVKGSRFTYAGGRLVLWSRDGGRISDGPATLRSGRFDKLAIAHPEVAPYGLAAQQTLERLRLWQRLQPKLVRGSSITQTFQFTETGNAELGFVALSQVAGRRSGSRWLVPAAYHDPIDQQAVLLARGKDNHGARAFLAYLRAPRAKAVIRRYGYETR
jgi:molybdate transport system substrate-binding protein